MRDYVNKEDWESAAIYDRKSGEIVETYGEYFPVDQINVRAKAAVTAEEPTEVPEPQEEPAESAQTKDDFSDAGITCTGVTMTDGAPATKKEMLTAIFEDQIKRGTMLHTPADIGEYAEYTSKQLSVKECREWYNAAFNKAALPKADYSDTINKAKSALVDGGYTCVGVTISHRTNKREFTIIRYAVETDDVNDKLAALNIINQIHSTAGIDFEACAEVVPTTSAEDNHAEPAGFFPVVTNIPRKSQWDIWNVHPDEYLMERVVPLVRCDEYCHVLETIYLKVDTAEEVKILMAAAAVGNRRRWPKYTKPYRRETVRRAADIIEKYYAENAINAARRITT